MIRKNRSIGLWFLAVALALLSACSRSDPDPGPAVDPAWSDWIKANHQEIRSLDAGDNQYDDLQFFKPLLAGRRLVQLGENGHGVAEFSQAKVRLIKFLHEEMGFDVIAFESNIFECFQADAHAGDWTSETMMGRSIFQVWHTEDVLELFRYIKESKRGFHPLTLAGFDVQYSSSGRLLRPAAFQEAVARIDPAYAAEVGRLDRDLLDTFGAIATWPAERVEKFRLFYDELRQWFDEHADELVSLYPQTPLLPLVLRQAAWSQRVDIDSALAPYAQGGFNIRDLGMADNVGMLLERLYPDKKIVLWAHDLHVNHDPNLTRVVDWDMFSLGYWLARRHRPLLYTVGFFMFEGEAAENDREVYQIVPTPTGTLESVLYQTGVEFAFCDMLNQQESAGNLWMFSVFRWMNSGTDLQTLVPRREYDGIFYVKTVHPPAYIRYYDMLDGSSGLAFSPADRRPDAILKK
jgi:erythromycin esterase